jgi:hypothetical protein
MEEMSTWLRDVEKAWTWYVQIITNKQKKRNRRRIGKSLEVRPARTAWNGFYRSKVEICIYSSTGVGKSLPLDRRIPHNRQADSPLMGCWLTAILVP